MYEESGSKTKQNQKKATQGKKEILIYGKKKIFKRHLSQILFTITYVYLSREHSLVCRLKQRKLKVFNCSSVSFEFFEPKYRILNFPQYVLIFGSKRNKAFKSTINLFFIVFTNIYF